MRAFEYQAPASLAEAVALLADKNGRARPFAGGTDLLVQLRLNRFELDLVVDIKKIPELNHISFDPNKGLFLGAAVSCARLCEAPEVLQNYPGLIDAASMIGGRAIQGRATLGGNLCNAAPSGDAISAMIALGATCTIAGPQGARTLPMAAFCTAPGQTVLDRGEILVSIHLPPPQSNSGARYLRFTPRREMDIAVAGAGVWLALDSSLTTITAARIALAAVAPTPLLVEAAGASLLGERPTEEAFAGAARLAQAAAKPITDVRGTAAQRRHLVGILVKRALHDAVRRAKGEMIHG
jgi:carbon-monoxide dehydrogenase medium subunit